MTGKFHTFIDEGMKRIIGFIERLQSAKGERRNFKVAFSAFRRVSTVLTASSSLPSVG